MNEEWRDIKGYEGKYQVSNLGRVKSLARDTNNQYCKVDKILKESLNKRGYLVVGLYKNGVSKQFKIHRLVALHFIDNPNKYSIINHKDENKENNRVDNLEWCTYQYNNTYGTRLQRSSEANIGKLRTEETKKKISKTRKEKGLSKGSRNPRARKVQCVTTGKVFKCIQEASEYYYINRNCISACCVGRQKTGGKHPVTDEKLVWKFID